MKNDDFEIICKFWAQYFGTIGVKVWPQFLKKTCRRSQNSSACAATGYKFESGGGDSS
jgi:hypothetical protein